MVPIVEVSSHGPKALESVIQRIQEEGIQVIGVHGPSPNATGLHPNLAAAEEHLERNYDLIAGSFETAVRVNAKCVTIHPFYVLGGRFALPKDDEKKFALLRSFDEQYDSVQKFLRSNKYQKAKEVAIETLRVILQRLDDNFPHDMALCLENLNPRITYGLQVPSEIVEFSSALGPRVKLDLDLPHAHLASRVFGFDLVEMIHQVYHHIGVVSLSQNHGGMYCVDRRFGESAPRTNLQDVDPHFPLHGAVSISRMYGDVDIGSENLAFRDRLVASVMFDPDGVLPIGTVPVASCLRAIPKSVPLVLEFDNRYAPMDAILGSYALTASIDMNEKE